MAKYLLYKGGYMHKVIVCGLDTSKLPKITNKEADELLLKIKRDNDETAKNYGKLKTCFIFIAKI